MKKLLLIILCMPYWAMAQDTITVHHLRYTTTYDRAKHYPVLVHWLIRKADVDCSHPFNRTEDFRPDPAIGNTTDVQQYYDPIAAVYDRGHNMDADDNECNLDQMHESFFFSNMTPQHHSLNRGVWKSLEGYTQGLAIQYGQVEVWSGSFGGIQHSGVMSIPGFCWKVIRYNGTIEAYKFPNDASVLHHHKEEYVTSVALLRSLTQLALPGL